MKRKDLQDIVLNGKIEKTDGYIYPIYFYYNPNLNDTIMDTDSGMKLSEQYSIPDDSNYPKLKYSKEISIVR